MPDAFFFSPMGTEAFLSPTNEQNGMIDGFPYGWGTWGFELPLSVILKGPSIESDKGTCRGGPLLSRKSTLTPTNMAPDRGSLEKEIDLLGTLPADAMFVGGRVYVVPSGFLGQI